MEPERLNDLHFPLCGIDVAHAYDQQITKQMQNGQSGSTTVSGINVRTYDTGLERARGGSRPGYQKFKSTQPAGIPWIIQQLDQIVGVGYTPPGTMVQPSQSGRVVSIVAVQQGNVYSCGPSDSIWTPTVNMANTNPPLNFSGVLYSSANNQKLYFADGVHYVYFDPSLNQVLNWVPGTTDILGNPITSVLPVDNLGNTPRLITTWRGRTCLSGLIDDPQNWFFSAISDPNNFDYNPIFASPSQAVAGNNGPLGLVGDVVTTMIPYTNDILVFGGDHTIWIMNGDPNYGGQLDLVSDAIGMAWGIPWCKDPYGTIYFMSNRTGVYSMVPGQVPVRISREIDHLLESIDTGTNAIRLVWNDRFQGFHMYITSLAGAQAQTHYFWEQRSSAWWQDQFENNNMNPVTVATTDGNLPGERGVIIGSWDGYVRYTTGPATTDDGSMISSSVMLGPFLTPDLDDVLFKDIQSIMAAESGDVTYNVYVGETAEIALTTSPVATGTWSAGRNFTDLIRYAGHAIYVQITSTNAWAMESVRCRIQSEGKVRRRVK